MLSAKDYGMLAVVVVGQDRQLARALSQAALRGAKVRRAGGDASTRLVLFAAALNDALHTTHVTIEENDAHRLIEQATGGSTPRKRSK